jgi:hypothetical protein
LIEAKFPYKKLKAWSIQITSPQDRPKNLQPVLDKLWNHPERKKFLPFQQQIDVYLGESPLLKGSDFFFTGFSALKDQKLNSLINKLINTQKLPEKINRHLFLQALNFAYDVVAMLTLPNLNLTEEELGLVIKYHQLNQLLIDDYHKELTTEGRALLLYSCTKLAVAQLEESSKSK